MRQLKCKGKAHLVIEEEKRAKNQGLDLLTQYRDYLFSDDASRGKSHKYYWGNDGKIHRNAKRDADRFATQAAREQRQTPADPQAPEFPEPAAPGPDSALEAAVSAAEAVARDRTARRLRQFCASKGSSYLAALARLRDEFASVRAAAEAYAVSEKAVRYAKTKVLGQAKRIAREESQKI